MNEQSNMKPKLGICVGRSTKTTRRTFKRLAQRRISMLENDLFDEIIVFTLENLNIETSTLKGQIYRKKDNKIVIENGAFSIPDVIYMQSEVNHCELQEIEKLMPGRIFNNHFYNKFEGSQILSENKSLRSHLPHSRMLNEIDDLDEALEEFHEFYLKPIRGHSGKGIIWVKKDEDHIKIETAKKTSAVKNSKEIWNLYPKGFSTGKYMIQQGIQTAKWKGKSTDIRLNMNKNGIGDWDVSLLVGRIALKKPFVSRGSDKNMLMYIEPFLKEMFLPEKIITMKKSIIQLGHEIGKTFDDSSYHMGDIGIDLGLDQRGDLWIFEVNHLPYPIRSLKDQDLSFTRPFEYAYYLSQR
ncbi:hypothetical protein FS935_00910 [Metabacillus litoralis]|uniref:YheC/YheD family protein n=1 Tax=Metabacillus litoralis TaxID=152268 RepID=A0A5C6WAC2_9BACI|nr:YheC/YheD family protein [Metabacillus litoralis]TXC92792.1 hypothetical protein FS935_00910 [Metabacillus litoralis]